MRRYDAGQQVDQQQGTVVWVHPVKEDEIEYLLNTKTINQIKLDYLKNIYR